ncbi:MAG: ABC transporter permease [Hyphomicrobiaceae bacterium]
MNELGRPIVAASPDIALEPATLQPSLLGRAWQHLIASPAAMFGGSIVLFWVLVALFAPWISLYPPNAIDPALVADPYPSAVHWLGVDHLGRDVWSRIAWGARTVLTVAPAAVFGAAALGTLLGLWSGYRGGFVDRLVMRAGDTILAFPKIILYLIVVAKFGASAFNIVAIIAVTQAPIIARIVRAVTLDVKNRDYVAAARMRGEGTLYILLAEILPNARGPLLVDFFLRLGYTVIAIGVLGFLGVGLPPPDPDWGGMVKETYGMIFVWPHMTLIPAAAISSLVIGFNFLATGLREAAHDG